VRRRVRPLSGRARSCIPLPLFPQAAGAGEASVALEAAARKEPQKERTPRVDWAELLRKTFDFDVFKTQTAKTPSASRSTAGSSGYPGARRLRA
jgi:hypothetical protein